MVQTADHYVNYSDVPFEDLETLKKYLRSQYNTVKTLEFSLGQTTTAAAVELMEDSGETIVHLSAAAATLSVYQKTDQVGTDGGAVITFQYITITGTLGSCTTALNAVNTSTAVATGITDFFRLVPGTFHTSILAADEVLLGLHDKSAIYGVIKVGCWQDAQSRFYALASTYRCFLARVEAKGAHTDPSTYTITLTRKGDTLQTVHSKNDLISTRWDSFDPCWELAPLTDLTITILKNADANHGTLTLRYKLLVAY